MTSVLQSFGFGDQLVRTVERSGAVWFVGNDVCAALEIGNPRDALSRLEQFETDDVGITDAIGREQRTTIVSESGMYALVFTSRKEAAKRFRRWVTEDVLPTLRRTGSYRMPDAAAESIEDAPSPAPALPMVMETPDQFEAMRMKLRTVEAARMAFGPAGARRAWKMAGLPDLSDPDVAAPGGLAVIEALHRSMAEWMASRTEAAPGHREEASALYADYVGWAREEGYASAEILSQVGFGRALSRCNVTTIKSGRVHRVGLKIAA